MTQSTQVVKFGNGIVDQAKSLEIDPKTFINLDTTNTAIRYKQMAPIVIASRLKTMAADCEDKEEKMKLLGFIGELETAQQYGIDQGKCELINWASIQSTNTVKFLKNKSIKLSRNVKVIIIFNIVIFRFMHVWVYIICIHQMVNLYVILF